VNSNLNVDTNEQAVNFADRFYCILTIPQGIVFLSQNTICKYA